MEIGTPKSTDTATSNKVKELEAEKERLIAQYLRLQDDVDALNERIYHVCCDVEILNQRIALAREEEQKKLLQEQAKAALKNGQNGNGRH